MTTIFSNTQCLCVLQRKSQLNRSFTGSQFTHCSLFDFYRPSIADQVHIGYFSQDRSSQTEVSEIAQLKEMTEVLQNLVRVRFKVKNAGKD